MSMIKFRRAMLPMTFLIVSALGACGSEDIDTSEPASEGTDDTVLVPQSYSEPPKECYDKCDCFLEIDLSLAVKLGIGIDLAIFDADKLIFQKKLDPLTRKVKVPIGGGVKVVTIVVKTVWGIVLVKKTVDLDLCVDGRVFKILC